MKKKLNTTPLYEWHLTQGANMADFGGFDMPLWYDTGVKSEHLAVLKSAGIFDTSHMDCINVKGEGALTLLNYCFTRDIKTLKRERCIYGAFLDVNGHCIDDAIIYKFNDSFFMICINAGMGQAIASHLTSNITDNLDVSIENLSNTIAKMDIQGINSAKILSKLIKNPEEVFGQMPYFSFKGYFDESMLNNSLLHENRHANSTVQLLDGTYILLSRSGYTGEFGFEIFIRSDAIVTLWKDIIKQGEHYNITACGLAARDSLRTGACLPLSHQDIGNWKFVNHPWDFALAYNHDKTGFTKDFIGCNALLSDNNNSFIYPFVGESLRKVTSGKNTHAIDETGTVIGKVLTCVTDMGITWHRDKIVSINSKDLPKDLKIKGLSCGFVMVDRKLNINNHNNNLSLTLKEGKRSIKVRIVKEIRPDRTARIKLRI